MQPGQPSSQERPRAGHRVVHALLIAAVALVVVEGLWRAYPLRWADSALADRWHTARGVRADLDLPVVLVAIDDASLTRISDPLLFWTAYYGTVIERLREHGATVIGFDLLQSASAEGWLNAHGFGSNPVARTWEIPFRRQLVQGDVTLVAMAEVEDGADIPCRPPLPEYAALLPKADTHLGYANLAEDSDGVVRRFRPVVAVGEPHRVCPRLHIASLLALRHLGLDPAAPSWQLGDRALDRTSALVPIAFAGPSGTYPSIPIWRLVEDGALTEADKALIRGRIAIVGADHLGNHDIWTTPFDRLSGDHRDRMPGYEVLANAITTLVRDVRIVELGDPGRLALLALTGLGLSFAFSFLPLRTSLVGIVLHTLAWPVGGYAAFRAFDVILPSASAASLGLLVFGAVYAARFAGEVRERRFLRDVFSRYVSDDVVGEILSSPDKLHLGGARREITILFSDIRNFTTISEKLAPEEVVEMLNAYFSRVCPPIVDQRGRVDKFIGDAVMAVFGAPVQQPDHARRALVAAIGMARGLESFRGWVEQRFADRDLPPFDIGVGVHTGHAVAGNIGFEKLIEYAVIGDAVNTASRIEGLTKSVGVRILASRQTVERAGPGVKTGKREEMRVKGRAEPVVVFEILDVSTDPAA